MKTVTFDEARVRFEALFDLAAGGETVVIARDQQRVAVHSMPSSQQVELAPAGYFLNDYDEDEVAELNALASHAPQTLVP